jgi:signal transduction histidine kinase
MADAPIDPRWPKILSLSVHEFRTPMTVIAGYIRMLLKDRAGTLTEQQRKLLEEAEKSCGRLSALVAEVSELSNLEAGTAPFNKQRMDLRAALRNAVEQLPPMPDREVSIDVQVPDGSASIEGDPVRLAQALGAILAALRRELVASDRLIVRERRVTLAGRPAYELLIGDEDTIAAIEADDSNTDTTFDEWRGGVGLSLLNARRILNKHGGVLWAPPEGRKAGARVILPFLAPS